MHFSRSPLSPRSTKCSRGGLCDFWMCLILCPLPFLVSSAWVNHIDLTWLEDRWKSPPLPLSITPPPSWFCMFEFQVLMEHVSKKKKICPWVTWLQMSAPPHCLFRALCVEERKVGIEANANVRIHFQHLVYKIQVKQKGTPARRYSHNNNNYCIHLCHDETASV